MAKKRTLCPFYTKPMQRMTAVVARSGDLSLILMATDAVKQAMKDRRLASALRWAYA